MPKYFYSDCVISDVHELSSGRLDKLTAKAKIDGRETVVSMTREMYRYFIGVGVGTKNRVWFSVLNLFGKKIVMVLAVENEAGERLESKDKFSTKFKTFIFDPLMAGFLIWFVAWVVLIIPVSIFSHSTQEAFFNVSVLATLVGISITVWSFVLPLKLKIKCSNLGSWPAGDMSRYTKAVKPEFGAGLATLKK